MSDVLCFCYFFFFKQKTAYEMRISDWSSDVCSSDLLHRPHYGVDPDQGIQGADPLRRVQRIRDRARPRPATARVRRRAAAQLHQPVEAHDRRPRPADRKSVVEGQSVSVSVELGGGRILKNKKKKCTQRNHTPK